MRKIISLKGNGRNRAKMFRNRRLMMK